MRRPSKLLRPWSGLLSLSAVLGGCQHDRVASSGWRGPPEAQAVAVETIENAILGRLAACIGGRTFDTDYVPLVKVSYDRDGTLEEAPILLNPPRRDKDRPAAETAMRIARECDAAQDAKRYQIYYGSWHHYVLRFELSKREKGRDGPAGEKAVAGAPAKAP